MMRFMCTTAAILALVLLCPPATLADCPGDLDGNGVTDLTDLGLLLEAHGTMVGDPGYNPSADLDRNGLVDLPDLARLIEDQGCRLTEPVAPAMPTEDLPFDELQIGNKRVLFHQRMIGDATVEGDYIVYQYDQASGALLKKIKFWRDDLPDEMPDVISQEEAEVWVEGEIQFSKLYYISPDSHAFLLDVVPVAPCWVVNSDWNGQRIVRVIDAVTGEYLGDGVPPPNEAFVFSGPMYFGPCYYQWIFHYMNARDWFNEMGYSTEDVLWPTEDQVRTHIQSTRTAIWFGTAHGDSYSFQSGCLDGQNPEYTYSCEIEEWIEEYPKMPFTWLAHCDGMCEIGEGTFSHAFRKGSNQDTATVGYCGLSYGACDDCWINNLDWQDTLFTYLGQGMTVKAAFDQANADYPMCVDDNWLCTRFAGDEDFAIIPKVRRDGAKISHQEAGQMPPAEDVEP